ncbi:hypothetical protein CcaCcLH18_02631 [Colletotrichum camelliae]|nr:hypothetical protein CcaCcLH18_02631 [Colletotrichum camelliae]
MSTQPIQETVPNLLWGPDDDGDRQHRLSKFLDECAHEHYVLSEKRPHAAHPDEDIAEIIGKIKSEVPLSKEQLLPNFHDGNAPIVDCVVRMIFMTATKSSYAVGGGLVAYVWKNSETIVDFLDRVYTARSVTMIPDQPINIRNLRALNMIRHTGIRIQPTNKLSDHLHLIYGDDFKILLVFHHRFFLEYSLQRLKHDRGDLDQSTAEAVRW